MSQLRKSSSAASHRRKVNKINHLHDWVLAELVRPPVDDAALNSEIVISEPFVVALPATHHFASRPRLELSALANEPFVLPPRDAVPIFMSRCSGPAARQASSRMRLTKSIICRWSSGWWRWARALRWFRHPPARTIRIASSIGRFAPRPLLCKRPLRGVEKTRLRRWPNSSAWRDDRCITCASRAGEFPSPARASGVATEAAIGGSPMVT